MVIGLINSGGKEKCATCVFYPQQLLVLKYSEMVTGLINSG